MRRYAGQTLIELIVFIVVMGIVISGSMLALQTVLLNSAKPAQILTASQLADARMNLIIQQRRINGFLAVSDPCSSGALAACAGLNTFATNNGYVVSSSISAAVNGVITATVTVNGTASANIVARFVQ